MWHINKSVVSVYAHADTQTAHAIIEGVSGWIRIAPTSSDGVTNVLDIIKGAKANDKRVNVFIDLNKQIVAAYLN